jgi:ribosomal protein L12E/L44/L45/RPP1/RPP2
MKTLTVLFGAATGVAATISVGVGVAAAAPDVVGQTYADAAQAIQAAGSKPVIATRIGGRTDEAQCIVTNAWVHTTVTQVYEKPKYDEVRVALNCSAAVASAGSAGPSAASPEGRQALKAQDAG